MALEFFLVSYKENLVQILLQKIWNFLYVICENIGEQAAENVMIYPNPANDVVYVSLKNQGENISWVLYNVSAQVVKKADVTTSDFEINLGDVKGGLYFLNINVDGKQMVKKVVVE